MTGMHTKRLASALVGLSLGAALAVTFALGDSGTAPAKTRINQAAEPAQPVAAQTVVKVGHFWYRPAPVHAVVVTHSVAAPTPPKPAEPARSVAIPAKIAVAPRVTEPASPVGPRAAAPTPTTAVPAVPKLAAAKPLAPKPATVAAPTTVPSTPPTTTRNACSPASPDPTQNHEPGSCYTVYGPPVPCAPGLPSTTYGAIDEGYGTNVTVCWSETQTVVP